jgi:hypothetical protein
MPAMLVTLMLACYKLESVMKMSQLINGFQYGLGTDASGLNPNFLDLYLNYEFVFK